MKRFLKLGLIAIILGVLSSLLVAGPAFAADWDTIVADLDVYEGSTGQVADVTVEVPSTGLGGFDIGLACDTDVARITNVVVNAGYLGVVNISTTGATAHVTGYWNGPGPAPRSTDVVVASVVLDTVGAAAAAQAAISFSAAPEFAEADGTGDTGAGTGNDVTIILQPDPDSDILTSLSPVAGIKISVDAPISDVSPAVGATSFVAKLTADPGTYVQVLGVAGLGGWSATLDGGLLPPYLSTSGVTVTGSRASASVGGDLALVKISLVGPTDETADVEMTWAGMLGRDENGGTSVIDPIDPVSLTFQRGDANNDNADLDITDVTYGGRYLVGLEHPTDESLINLASVVHDGAAGDVASPADVLRMMQYLAGLTDDYFNLTS